MAKVLHYREHAQREHLVLDGDSVALAVRDGRLDPNKGPTDVCAVALVPNGRFVAGTIFGKLFSGSCETFEITAESQKSHPQPVTSIAVLLNGTVASASMDCYIAIHDPVTGKQLAWEVAHEKGTTTLLALSDGTFVAGSADGEISQRNQEGAPDRDFESSDTLPVVAFSELPNGTLASATSRNIRLWDLKFGLCTRQVDVYSAAALTHLNGFLIVACSDGRVELRKLANGKFTYGFGASQGHCTRKYFSTTAEGNLVIADATTLRVMEIPKEARSVRPELVAITHHAELTLCATTDRGLLGVHRGFLCTIEDGVRTQIPRELATIRAIVLREQIPRKLTKITAIALLPGGKFAVGTEKGTLEFWDGKAFVASDGSAHRGPIVSIVVLTSGLVVACAEDSWLSTFDPQTGKQLAFEYGNPGYTTALLALDSGGFVFGTNRGKITTVNLDANLTFLTVDSEPVRCFADLPGNTLASATNDCVRVWDTAKGRCLRKWYHRGCSHMVFWSGVLAVARDDGLVEGRDTLSCRVVFEMHETSELPLHLSVSAANNLVLATSMQAVTWAPTQSKAEPEFELFDKSYQVKCVDRQKAKLTALFVTGDEMVQVEESKVYEDDVTCIVVVDTTHIFGTRQGDVHIPDKSQKWKASSMAIEAMCELPEGRVAIATRDGKLCIWKHALGTFKVVLHGPAAITALLNVSGGLLCAVGKNIMRWNGKTFHTFQRMHTNSISSLALLGNGQCVSGSRDSTVRFWDAVSGECLETLTLHTAVVALAVIEDGMLAVGFEDSSVNIMDPNLREWVARVHKSVLGRVLIAAAPDNKLVVADNLAVTTYQFF